MVKSNICGKGHNKDIVGRDSHGHCLECKREYNQDKTKIVESKIQFCPQGHDTFIYGRDTSRSCKECKRIDRRKYFHTHKIEQYEYARKYNLEHPESKKKSDKKYNQTHKKELLAKRLARLKLDISFKLSVYLRNRIRKVIKFNWRTGSAVRDLGCTLEELKKYLENKFYDGMTWENYGSYWVIDHIKELCTFDLRDKKQFLKAVNYKNLQPLTKSDHIKKTNKERKRRARMRRNY